MSDATISLRETRARFLLLWVLPIVVMGLTAFAGAILNDGDTFWHIAAGRWIIGHHTVPAVDPFSFTFAGQPWTAQEWLSEALMAGAWLAAGWSGVMLLTALAMGSTAALMAGWLKRWLSPIGVIAALVLGLACVAPSLLARPHILVLPVLTLWTIGLLKARLENRAPSFQLIPLMAIWANLHSSFVVGLGLAGVLALEAALDFKTWRRRNLLMWAAFVVGGFFAAMVTPHGLAGLVFPLRVLGMSSLPGITEWRGPDFMKLEPVELVLLAGLFALFWKGARLSAVRALLLLGLVHMTLQHIRQEVLLGVIAPLLVAEPLGRALGAVQPAVIRWRLPLPQSLLGAGLLAAIVIGRLAIPEVRVDGPTAPITALAAVPPTLARQPVLNAYDFGGYLIFKGVRPYIDGRADMYGDGFVANDTAIQRGDGAALDAAIKRYNIRWSIFTPDQPVVGVLEREGWKTLYKDRFAVVQEKVGP